MPKRAPARGALFADKLLCSPAISNPQTSHSAGGRTCLHCATGARRGLLLRRESVSATAILSGFGVGAIEGDRLTGMRAPSRVLPPAGATALCPSLATAPAASPPWRSAPPPPSPT